MDEAYKTFIKPDESCDSLEPRFSGLSVWVSFTLRAWMTGLDAGEEEFSCGRRLCLIASLFPNSVCFSLSHRHTLFLFSSSSLAICASDIPPSMIEESADRGGVSIIAPSVV